jgi:glutamate transport system substrate-binding protein
MAAAVTLTLAACSGGGDGDGDTPPVDPGEFPAGSTMARLAEAGEITIGTKFDQPGFGLLGPDGTPVGFDVEIAKLIAGELGIAPGDINWIETISANREPFIQNGQVDIVVATYTINDSRKKVVDFAGPYYEAGQALMVRIDDDSITTPEDLAGKSACSAESSTPAGYMQANYPDVKLELLGNYSDCLDLLRNKQVDAVTTDNVILAGYVAESPDDFKVVGEPFTTEPYGIGLAKGDDDFRTWINDTLEALYTDGRWIAAWEDTAGAFLPTPEPPAVDRY